MSNIKKFLNFSLILLAFTVVFSSCSKDESNEVNPQIENNEANNFAQLLTTPNDNDDDIDDGIESFEDCFTINYPITVSIPGGDDQIANSEEELCDIFDTWYEANQDDLTEYPTIQFPISVTLADGSTTSVNNEEELCDLFIECYGDDDWDDDDGDWGDDDGDWEDDFCFDYVYPLTIEMEDGSTMEIASEEDWYTVFDSLGTYQYFTLVYPINIELTDGTLVTINSEEEFEPILEDCIGEIPGPGDCDSTDLEICFEFAFPMSIGLPDGSTITANSDEELFTAIEDYYEQNPNSTEEPELLYPVNVVLEDGTPLTLNSEEELIALLEECFGDGFGLINPRGPMQAFSKMTNL